MERDTLLVICRSELALYWQRNMRPDYNTSPMRDANGNLLLLLSSAILRIRFENALYKTILLIADYFSMEVLIGTRFMSCQVKSIRCVEQKAKSSEVKIPLLGSAPERPMAETLESMEYQYNRPTTDTSTELMEFYPKVMYHNFALCKYVTLPHFTVVGVEVVTIISCLIHTESKHFS